MQTTPRESSGSQDTPLFDLVFQRISKSPDRAIPFHEFMEMALYHDIYGYYSRPETRAIGRTGDFYTSVSVGETFGFLLAHRIVFLREKYYAPDLPFVIVEQGAHDGALARDIMTAINDIDASLLERIEYRIVEPRLSVRNQLAGSLAPQGISMVPSLNEAKSTQGIFLCNELLDAFPVHCLIFESGAWCERNVGLDETGTHLVWTTRPLPEPLTLFAAELGNAFPDGYHTEVCSAVDAWMEEASRLFEKGVWWVIDYGYERQDYYLPQRTTGTLRSYKGHRASENLFTLPGEQDITSHVDFTRVELAAQRHGLKRRQFTDQHHFLIEAARPWLLAIEAQTPDPKVTKRLRQFQTLTHPSLMGQRFKVMELSRGISDEPHRVRSSIQKGSLISRANVDC